MTSPKIRVNLRLLKMGQNFHGQSFHILYYTKNMIKIFILILHVGDPLVQKNIKKKYCYYYYY